MISGMKMSSYISLLPLMLLLIACNESLPVREDTTDLVTTKIRSLYQTTSHSSEAGKIRLFVTMVNKTDETLDDISKISGTMEITWQLPKDLVPLFDITRTIQFGPNDVFYAKRFNQQTRRLTLDPNDSIVISVVWNLKSNDSTYLLNYFPWLQDLQCYVVLDQSSSPVPRRISIPQYFSVKANVKLFDKLSILYVQPFTIKHCIMHGHRGEANAGMSLPPCTDFIQFDPCSAIGR
jgi:hypothetical protein